MDHQESLDRNVEAVARVARAALAPGFGQRRDQVPEALVRAIAEGRGDRAAVAEATRQAFGTERPLSLVLFDTDRIASYVFESSRPPVIAGASKILSELNREIEKNLYPREVVFSGGGEGMLLVPLERGEELCRRIEDLYREKTRGALSVTTGFLPVGPPEFIRAEGHEDQARDGARVVSGTQAVLARLRDQVRREKDSRLPRNATVSGGQPRCGSCRDRAAGGRSFKEFRRDAPFDFPLCDPCGARWDVGKRQIRGVSFEEMIEDFSPRGDGSSRGKGSYIGFLYADGNSMGALFGGLTSLSELRFLSRSVRLVFERLRRRVEGLVRDHAPGLERDRLPLVSYLGGGDEAIWILPGALAVRVAERLDSWIAEESEAVQGLSDLLRDRTGSRSLTFGAGLVLSGFSYPVRYQYELAKELQKNAKAMFYRAAGRDVISSLDFEVLTDSSPLSEKLSTIRKNTYGTEEEGFLRTCRPYTAAGFRDLLGRIGRAFDPEIEVATSQLYSLQVGSAEGRRIFLNYLLYQIARKPAGPKYQEWLKSFKVDLEADAIEKFFVQPLPDGAGTWISDGLQLAPFLAQLRRREA